MNDKLDRIVIVPESVLFQEVSGESVLLDLQSERYFSLNGVGTRSWQLILQHSRLADVFAALREEYDVDPEVLQNDLVELVEALVNAGLVFVEDQSA